nr:integrase, catalytic region, zinc finger, CCHC-type, peptidase aspartic, catalytic [Tanacetum cinerariifolium]
KEAQIKLYKTRKDQELDKVIALENKVKVLDNIVYKIGQSLQTMNMLNNKCRTSFAKPEFLKKAQRANPRLYDIGCYNDNLALMLTLESNDVIRLEKESRSKLSDLIRPFDNDKLNNLYDLFVPQREKSFEQRYFSKRSRLSHTPVNNGNSKDVDTIIDGVERCKETIAKRTYFGHIDPFIKNTNEGNFSQAIRRINAGLEQFHKCLNEEMVADLRYFNSLELEVDSLISTGNSENTFLNEIDRLSREYYYVDHMNVILGVYTELDEVTNLQCDYLELLEKCKCLENELSKSKMMSKSFEALQKHAINIEIDLQQCQEKIKNEKIFKVNQTQDFCKERKQYFEIQDLKAQLQDKGIVIRVILTTSVSRPQLKSNPMGDRVMHNNSQGKKHEVEDQRRNVKLSKNKPFVTASRRDCPIHRQLWKPRNITRKLYERVSKRCSWWYPKFTPLGYKWKPKSGQENVNPNLVEIVLFIVNSGCSKHMTGNLKLLINFVEKVYYVEGLNHNLFSVGQFCDADLEVTFRKSTCYIFDLKGNDLLIGSRGTDLYSIILQDINCPNPICLMAKATSSQAWLWHRRLSHLNFDTINLLSKNDIVVGLPKLKFVKDHLSSSRELGKAKRKSFHTKITPNSKRRLQLPHIDLCGPMRVASINRKRYVLVIVDDYFRYNWTHFLRSKDKTPEVLIDFLRIVQRGLQAQSRDYRAFNKRTRVIVETIHVNFDELPQMASDHVSSDPHLNVKGWHLNTAV